MSRFPRKESPPRFDNYHGYRPFLRRDFRQLCAYCERSEFFLGGEEQFEIDHFRPVNRFPELTAHYPNLYYACAKCNRHKAFTWPSESLLTKGFRFSDPCEEDMYVEHLREGDDGKLEALTHCGEYTREHLQLNRADVVRWRTDRRSAAQVLATLDVIKKDLLGQLDLAMDPATNGEILAKIAALESAITRRRQEFSLADPNDPPFS